MSTVSLRLPDDLADRLQHLADVTGRTKTYYMLEALSEHLDEMEDVYIAEERLVEYRAGTAEKVTLDAVMGRHGVSR